MPRHVWPLATLRTLAGGSMIKGIEPHGRRLMEGIRTALKAASIPAVVTGFPQVVNVAFGLTEPACNDRGLMDADKARYLKFTHLLLKRRVRALDAGRGSCQVARTRE